MFVLANGLMVVLGAYLAVGACFAVAFAVWGAQTIDPAGKGMSISTRLLILPGATALWPLLLKKWLGRQLPPLA